MNSIAVAFWGAFMGSAVLMMIGSVALFMRGMRRAAWMAAVSTVVPVLYVLPFLGWFTPGNTPADDRLLAHLTVFAGASLSLMLLSLLGRLRQRGAAQRAYWMLGASAGLILAAGWALPPYVSLILSCFYGVCLGAMMLVVVRRFARERHRTATNALGGVITVIIAVGCLSAIGLLRGDVHWTVHATAATSGVIYMAIMAAALWSRVAHLIELKQVMSLGPTYDTITRMPSHAEAGKVVGAFLRKTGLAPSVGVIAVSIANLRPLESLHGRAAQNHALFVCASRLRGAAPLGAQLCRLGDDGFLMLINSPGDTNMLRQLARQIRQRMLRAINLNTGQESDDAEGERTEWMPEIGVGIALSDSRVPPGNAVATARAISRTAWGYSSRMAWTENTSNEVSELALEPDSSTSGHGSGMGWDR